LQNGTAPGVWTLADAAYWTKQGLWPLAGNFLAVEDVFSTWLYTGTTPTPLTINNGINLSGRGGMVWVKSRNAAYGNFINDTVRGATNNLLTNTTDAQFTNAQDLTGFTSSGFSLGTNNRVNDSAATFVSWTFREAPKFFDVVTYTGNGTAGRSIAHNLGGAPGCIMVKRTDGGASPWIVFHRSTGATNYLILNAGDAAASSAGAWNNTAPTDTAFTVGNWSEVNANGGTYVAYLYAHDAASDGIIQCGVYAGNSSTTGPNITLGWEPQWLMVKRSTVSSGDWNMFDNMRGMPVGSAGALLRANLANAERNDLTYVSPTATGFQVTGGSDPQVNGSGSNYIYIAIRRGPMRTPTLGTSVFSPQAYTSASGTQQTTNFPTDLVLSKLRSFEYSFASNDRLRGFAQNAADSAPLLETANTNAESNNGAIIARAWNTGFVQGGYNGSSNAVITYAFRRAPGFFDEVCYTGTGANLTLNHNLGVAPELMITKMRNGDANWLTYSTPTGAGHLLALNLNIAKEASSSAWNNTAPTATQFTVGSAFSSGFNYVAYLFASCPGVSKVGSYTGNGSSQTINCAFTTGARFVLIKRTDSTGGWLVWDSARGIVAGNDPYLALNSTAVEVTTNDSVDTDNTGFVVNQVAASNVNVNGATYIFLAVA
jgi:hypothetical protein